MPIQKESIAIVGIGCRTPGGALNASDFWDVLISGNSAITDTPADRWNIEEYYDPTATRAGRTKTARGGFIDGIGLFDNEFFNMFPTEAESIDPQQRLLLQATFEALEDSGDTLATFRGSKTAVYIGAFASDYQDILADPDNRYRIRPQSTMGSSLTSLANRISYLYDLKGPSISLDTACSASLVAVHLACQSIWHGEAAQAIAGGVNININPALTIMLSKGSFLSADGACKSFDESGNGYVRSEGVGLVYLKPLSQALSDSNKIYGLIRGTACNSDGYTSAGFTVPNAKAQTNMLIDAYANAGVKASRVQYIEAHGTGTSVGDPLETEAFGSVFAEGRPQDKPLLIGSVKSNIGHLEGAAGIAGLIKLALCLHHKVIPANLHFNVPNPKIDFTNWRLKVVDRKQHWPAPDMGGARLGGVNSFGAGGTNAHAVLEEYLPDTETVAGLYEAENIPSKINLFTCSAQSEEALKALLGSYQDYLSSHKVDLNQLCFNVGKHRSLFPYRVAIAATSPGDLKHKINQFLQGNLLSGVVSGQPRNKKPRLAFVFTGQGPQWYAMGRQLIEKEPVFRWVIQKIESYFQKISGWSLLEEMIRPESESRISDTRIAQPAIMALQIALVELWKQKGIEPDGVVGHSIGEVAAAYTAGALTLEQAVQVIYNRSRGQHAAAGKGGMLAVGMTLEAAKNLISNVADRVSIAAVNGPENIVLSGDMEPLAKISEQLTTIDVFNRFLKVDVPFHSHHMEPLKEELISSLSDLTADKAKIALYSTVTGKQGDGQHLDSGYWYQNVRDPVYFAPALAEMVKDGFDTFIEIGPHPALSDGAQELFSTLKADAQIFPSIRRKEDELLRFNQTLAALFVAGQPIDWSKVCPGAKRLHDLPRYVWQQKYFWHESLIHQKNRLQLRLHPHITSHQDSGLNTNKHTFSLFLDRQADPYLADHLVDDMIIFPGSGHMELATVAARKAFGDAFSCLHDINFESGLFLPDNGEIPEINLEIYSDECRYWIMSRDRNNKDAKWVKHSSGIMNCADEKPAPQMISLAEIKEHVNERIPVQPMYNEMKRAGLLHDTLFRTIQDLWFSPGKLLAKIMLPDSLQYGVEHFLLHPTVSDAALHAIFASRRLVPDEELGLYLPVRVQRYNFFVQPEGRVIWSYLTVHEANEHAIRGDVVILDDITGEVVAEITGLELKYVAGTRHDEEDLAYSGCYEYKWVPDQSLTYAPLKGVEVLLIADDVNACREIKDALAQVGAQVLTMGNMSDCDWSVNLEARNAVSSTLAEIKKAHPNLNRVVNMLAKDQWGEDDLFPRMENLVWKSLNVCNAIIENEFGMTLWTLACYSDKVCAEDDTINLVQAPVYLLSRTLNNEFPLATCKVIDLGSGNKQALHLSAALIASQDNAGKETEIAIRGGAIYVHRLQKIDAAETQRTFARNLPASGSYYQACLNITNDLNSVQLHQHIPAALKDNEVEVAIKAAAINDKENLYQHISQECSGVVTRVGSAVCHFREGDAVIALANEAVAGMVITPECYLAHKPKNLTFEQAATIPLPYMAAYHSLHTLANIKQGDSVLIHNATRKVGLAAIQLAQRAGAVIFATADTAAHQEYLRAIGIKYVYDSQTLDFHQQIMSATLGKGVDIVLNDLDGRGRVQSLKSLRPFGRFIEINSRNVAADATLQIHLLESNASYFFMDIRALLSKRPEDIKSIFERVIGLFCEQNPLTPPACTLFPVNQLPEALEHTKHGQTIGSVVITMEGEAVNALPGVELHLDPEKIYLITGGASGLGIELAKWLVEKGARKLALVSRSGPKTEYDLGVLQTLRELEVKVLLLEADLTDARQVSRMVEQVKAIAPLGGVIHGAAVMQNALIQNLQREDFLPAFSAKAIGGWNLHQALLHDPLDFFLSISSIVSVFGFGGQFSYALANNFLDKLTRYRQLQGMPAQAINLGVLGEFSGLTKNADRLLNLMEKQGWGPMNQKQVTEKTERIILDGNVVRMAANIDWRSFREHFEHLREDMRFANLLSDESLNIKSTVPGGGSLREKIQALSENEAVVELKKHLTEALARILGTDFDKIDSDKSMSSMGLDSLMMNQLRYWIQQKLEINYPLMKMVKGPSLLVLSEHILLELKETGESQSSPGDTSGISSASDLDVVHNWFVRLKRPAGGSPKKTKLFMMPSMGAGASMYAHFLYNPPADCEVYALQSPGRENRLNEENHTDLNVLLPDLEDALGKLLTDEKQQYGWDGDIVFYGHSYGGIIMFELYRLLREKGKKLPVHFFSSATVAPQLTGTWKNRDSLKESGNVSSSEHKILSLMTYIDDREFVKQILPGLRRDMPLLLNYVYQNGLPLDCPITVFSAIEDEVTLVDEMKQWDTQTLSGFQQFLVHGDHWFVSRNKEFIAEKLSVILGS